MLSRRQSKKKSKDMSHRKFCSNPFYARCCGYFFTRLLSPQTLIFSGNRQIRVLKRFKGGLEFLWWNYTIFLFFARYRAILLVFLGEIFLKQA